MRKNTESLEPKSSYNFVMKVNPGILMGVSVEKWSAFLKMMDEREVAIEKMIPRKMVEEVARDLGLSFQQILKINCARKCLALYDRKSKEFNKCYEKCRRTGDP